MTLTSWRLLAVAITATTLCFRPSRPAHTKALGGPADVIALLATIGFILSVMPS